MIIVYRIVRKKIHLKSTTGRVSSVPMSPPIVVDTLNSPKERDKIVDIASEQGENDDLEDMVLRTIARPPIEKCQGYWVIHSRFPDQEALVEKVDLVARKIFVEYCDSEKEATFIYDDPKLEWFHMSSESELEKERWAAVKIQSVMRGR